MSETKKEEENKNPYLVTFKKPVTFEEKKFENVDLSGLENMTGDDLITAEKMLRDEGMTGFNADLSTQGFFIYASMAAKLPVEFFSRLPFREARKVKITVLNFLLE